MTLPVCSLVVLCHISFLKNTLVNILLVYRYLCFYEMGHAFILE